MAAQYGEAIFANSKGEKYLKNIYFDDTAGNPVRFDQTGGGATTASKTEISFPEDVRLIDLVIAAATAQTRTSIQINGSNTGDCLHNAIHLAAITFRPSINITVKAGQILQLTQIA